MLYNKCVKYIKESFSYLFKHFPRTFVLVIVPSFLVCFFMQTSDVTFGSFFAEFKQMRTFYDVFISVFNVNMLTHWYMIPVCFLAMLLGFSYLLNMIEKHFRTGRLTLRHPAAQINNTFTSVLFCLFLLCALYALYSILAVCVISLIVTVANYFSLHAAFTFVLVAVLYIFSLSGIFILFRYILFVCVTMLVYGYYFKDALSVVMKIGNRETHAQLNFALLLPLMMYRLTNALVLLLPLVHIVQSVISAIIMSITLQYTAVFMLVAMFDVSGIERRDRRRFY